MLCKIYVHVSFQRLLTKDVSGCLDVNLHVILSIHAAKVDTEEAGVESRGVAVTYIANTRLSLREKIHLMYRSHSN